MAADSSPAARAALERLCQDYWPPLFAFALRQGNDPHKAQDLTQSFFAHFLEREYLRAADRSRGKFRTFLLTCFQHFLIHEWEKNRAQKRGGKFVLVSWEEHCDAVEHRAQASRGFSAEKLFDREWALSMMQRALARLEEEFQGSGKDRHFADLRKFLQTDAAPGEYQEIGNRLGLADRAVKLAVHRMRRRYGRLVREEVRETVAREADIADEMRHLVEVISG